MFEKLKDYLVQVALTKYLPMAGMSAIAALGTFMMAHAGLLEQWGVNYITTWSAAWLTTHAISGPILLIELDTTSTATITLVVGLVSLMLRATEHHVATAAAKPPQGETK